MLHAYLVCITAYQTAVLNSSSICRPLQCQGTALLLLQEKDLSAAAASAAATALKKQSMQSAGGDETAAHAVDGFVPRLRHTNAPSCAPVGQKGPGTQQPRNQQVTPQLGSTAIIQSVKPPSPPPSPPRPLANAPPSTSCKRLRFSRNF